MPGIGTGIRGRSASRRMITEKKMSQIASVFRSARSAKAPSRLRKSFSLERGAKKLSEINPSATIRATRISVWNCSIVLPLAEFISRNILGYQTWMGRQVRYRITDFGVEPAFFRSCYLSISLAVLSLALLDVVLWLCSSLKSAISRRKLPALDEYEMP